MAFAPLLLWTALSLTGAPATACSTPDAPRWTSSAEDPIDAWLDTGGRPVAAGFTAPPGMVADGPCRARITSGKRSLAVPAAARVAAGAPKGTLRLQSVLYRNHEKLLVEVELSGVRGAFVEGSVLDRGARVAVGSRVGVGVRVDGKAVDAIKFFQDHAEGVDPHAEPRLVVVSQDAREMLLVVGETRRRVKVGFGQEPGRKRVRGDNRTPRGMYFVVSHHRGEFSGPYGEYYGGHWVKLNYPNAFDAAYGVEEGLLDVGTARKVAADWRARRLTHQGSKLGGGIGFHGWAGEWSDDDPWLSWGCIVLHNDDIAALYDELAVGTMVILL